MMVMSMPHALPHETARIARRFHALSDPARVHIVEMVSHRERCVWELEQALDIAQSRLSFHLRVLREAGLLRAQRDGRRMYYALRPDALDEIVAFTESAKRGQQGGRCALTCCH
jgi:ArsR family transcriptional regulator